MAENSNTTPSRTSRNDGATAAARRAPPTAPLVVASSRNIPIRMSVIRSRTYAAAAPELVAMTLTMLAPIARRTSKPNRIVRARMTMIPLPTPASGVIESGFPPPTGSS